MLIQSGEYSWPDGLEVGVKLKDMVERLLALAPPDRLGTESATEVQAHPWLETVDWDKMDRRGYLVCLRFSRVSFPSFKSLIG
jgi:hypothetical protein